MFSSKGTVFWARIAESCAAKMLATLWTGWQKWRERKTFLLGVLAHILDIFPMWPFESVYTSHTQPEAELVMYRHAELSGVQPLHSPQMCARGWPRPGVWWGFCTLTGANVQAMTTCAGFGWGRVNFLHNVHSTNMGVHFGFVQWQMTSSSPTSCQLFRMTSQCPLDWVRSAIRGLFAIKDSIWWAAVAGWGGCETAQQTSSLMCGTASLSSPDNLECHPFHSHFLHTDCMENHTRDSFTSLTPHTSGIYGCMLLQLYVTWNRFIKGYVERHGVNWCHCIVNLVTQIWQCSSHSICPHTLGEKLSKKVDFFTAVSQKPYTKNGIFMAGALYSIAVGLNPQSHHLNIHAHMDSPDLYLTLQAGDFWMLFQNSWLCFIPVMEQELFKAVNWLGQW